MDITSYFLFFNTFICRYIPLKQWTFDNFHSPKYQKFKISELPRINPFIKQDWLFLLEYYLWRYSKPSLYLKMLSALTAVMLSPGKRIVNISSSINV